MWVHACGFFCFSGWPDWSSRRLIHRTSRLVRSRWSHEAIGPLAESVAAFHREASHAQACLNSRGEKDDEVTTNMRILATDSMRDAAALETSLAATRDLAKSTLSFFAIPYRPQEADPKMLDMINNLCEFIQLFEGCMKDLEAHPSLAKARVIPHVLKIFGHDEGCWTRCVQDVGISRHATEASLLACKPRQAGRIPMWILVLCLLHPMS